MSSLGNTTYPTDPTCLQGSRQAIRSNSPPPKEGPTDAHT